MKTRILTALIAVFFILPIFSMTALAAPDDTPDETAMLPLEYYQYLG